MNFLESLSKNEIIIGIGTLITLLLFLAGAIEKLFDKKYLGTIFCKFVWKCCKGFWKWARNEQLKEIKISLDIIQKEVTPNGGGSMKDIVSLLKRQHLENWTVVMGMHDFQRDLSIRMDVADEAANRMSFKLDNRRSCIYISENFLRFFGFTDRDVLGSDLEFCSEENHRRAVRQKYKTGFETRKKFQYEQILIDSDSNRHLCLIRCFPGETKEGKLNGCFGIIEVLESLDE
jgi:hypothetical protein